MPDIPIKKKKRKLEDHEPRDSVRLSPPNAKYSIRVVVAVEPKGWRDAWAVLRGRYKAQVYIKNVGTAAGLRRVLQQVWTGKRMQQQMYNGHPLRRNAQT